MLESRKKIEIQLRAASGAQQKKLKANIRPTIENEYAQRYLESIGVHATKDKVDYMLTNMPVERALVVPVWTRSALIVVPERVDEKDQNVIKQIYTGTKDIELSKRKLASFFGKGVSEPGTRPKGLEGSRGKSCNTRMTKSRGSNRQPPAQVDLSFPIPSKLPVIEIDSQPFRHMIKPLAVNDTRVKMAVKAFCASLSDIVPRIFEDKSGRINVVIQKFLSCLMCRRLFGLLCHYVFWNIIHPFVRRALLAAKAQHGHLLDQNIPDTQPELVENAALHRRKSMMKFSVPDMKAMVKDLAAIGAGRAESPQMGARFSRGSTVQQQQEKAPHSSHRAVTMFTRSGQDLHGKVNADKGPQSVEAGNSLAELTLSSETSLTGEEKEMLYLQLEQCLNKLHDQMGFNRQALINARESLVAGCHYIVNDIMQSHYTWLSGKREPVAEEATSRTSSPGQSLRRGVSYFPDKSPRPVFNDEDLKAIDAVRQEVTKHINKTLTELLDPARVYCQKIMREMFAADDVSASNLLTASVGGTRSGGVAVQKRNEQEKSYYATSMAVRAILSETESPQTRKFLYMNTSGAQPQLSAKYQTRGVTGEPSTFTTGTGSLLSWDDSHEIADSQEYDSPSRPATGQSSAGSPLPVSPTIQDFKSLFEHDLKVHPRQANTSSFNPRHSILYKRSESVEKSIRENRTTTPMHRVGSPSQSGGLPLRSTIATPCSRANHGPRTFNRTDTPDFIHPQLKKLPKVTKKAQEAEALLSAATRGKLMKLIVDRTKSQYSDSHILQYSRAPNARYRQDLLSGG